MFNNSAGPEVSRGQNELIVPNCLLNDPQLCSNNQLRNYIIQIQNQNQGVDLEEYLVVIDDEEPADNYQNSLQEQESSASPAANDIEEEPFDPSFEVDDPDIIIEKEIFHSHNHRVSTQNTRRSGAIQSQSQREIRSEIKITSAYSVINIDDNNKDNDKNKLPSIYKDARKPGLNYNSVIILTFIYTKSKVMAVQDLYKGLCQLFPYYLTAPPNWKNSIRHCLSTSRLYIKTKVPSKSAKSQYTWSISPNKSMKLQLYCDQILKRLGKFDPDKTLRNLVDLFLNDFLNTYIDQDTVDYNQDPEFYARKRCHHMQLTKAKGQNM